MNPINKTTLHPYSRSVSIIGVGCSPFMYTLDNPETAGLTEGELFGYAAYKAMEDAGVTPKDVDFYFHGQASPFNGSNYITPNMQVSEWFGMRGKGQLVQFIMPSPITRKPEMQDIKPYVLGVVELPEGPAVNVMVRGVNKKNKDIVEAKLPVNVHATIIQRDGYKTVIFDLDEVPEA